jgi:hypothetical protein
MGCYSVEAVIVHAEIHSDALKLMVYFSLAFTGMVVAD